MTKYIIIAVLVVLIMVVLVACAGENAVLSESRTYGVTSDIHSLNVEINSADFTIVQSNELSVESNLKNLSVTEDNGVLNIVDKTKHSVRYNNAKLTLYIPENITFESADINSGAGRLTADTLSAKTLKLNTGAGQVKFEHLNVLEKTDLKGGAGEIAVNDGSLNNLSLDLGAGQLNLTAALLGESNLKFGVGHSELTLLGDKDDYSFDVETGVGKVSIDGRDAFSFADGGNGENSVKIKGGVGATDINFK